MKELIISDYIELCCAILEEKYPSCFYYGDDNLVEIIKRIIFFRSLSDISHLNSLCQLTSSVLNEGDRFKKKIKLEDQLGLKIKKSESNLNTFIKVIYLIFRHAIKVILYKVRNSKQSKIYPYTFCIIHPRFLNFFSQIYSRIGLENCCSIGLKNSNKMSHVNTKDVLFVFSKIKFPILSPLVIVYLEALILYLQYFESLKNNSKTTILFAEGTSEIEAAVLLAAKKLSISTIKIQSGRGGILHTGYRNLNFDKTLVWGEGFIKRFQSVSKKSEYIVTGNFQIEAADTSIISNELKKVVEEHTVIAIFTQPINAYIKKEDYKKLNYIASKLLDTNRNIKIIVRKHPSDNSRILDSLENKYPNLIKITSIEEFSLSEIMEVAELAIGFYSTTLSEAAASFVLPVMLKNAELGDVFPCPCAANAGICVNDKDDVIRVINECLNDNNKIKPYLPSMLKFSEKYFGPQDGKSLDRILNQIQNI